MRWVLPEGTGEPVVRDEVPAEVGWRLRWTQCWGGLEMSVAGVRTIKRNRRSIKVISYLRSDCPGRFAFGV